MKLIKLWADAKGTLTKSLTILYKTFVHPQLEFCVSIWNPHLAHDIDILEKVQRRVTKLVPHYPMSCGRYIKSPLLILQKAKR